MGKSKDLGHLAHIVTYDAENHITVPAGITMHTNQLVASQSWVTTALGSYALSSSLGSYVPTSRTITINGTTYDLSANRSWDITSMIYPAAGIALSTGSAWGTSITNNSANWNTAYGWGNHASAGYATTSSLSSYLLLAGGTLTGALSGTSALFTGNLRTDTGLGLKYGSFVSTSGYLNLFSALIGSTITLNLKDGTGGYEIALNFPTSANRSYTFPSANGTIALTSDIPSLTLGNITSADTNLMTITGGTGAIIGSGVNITLLSATATNGGVVTTGTQTFAGAKTFSNRVTFGSAIADRPQIPGGMVGLDTGDGNFDIWGISRDYYPSNPTTANAWGLRWNGTNNDFEFVGGGVSRVILDMDSGNVTTGLLMPQGPGGNYNENVRLPGSTAVISFNTSGVTGAGSYNIVSQTNFQIRNAGGTQVFILDQSGNLTMSGTVTAPTFSGSLSGNASTASAAAGVSFLTQPNATWSGRIQLGGNGDPGAVAGTAVVQATDGNLHMDSGTGKSMYLNYYRNGIIYLNGGTYSISSNGSFYNGTASYANSAGAVAWVNVSSKPSLIMYYQGFTLDANTMDGNSTGFTYSVNAPYTGPIARFSETGYSLQLNAAYGGGGNLIAFRTRNGDAGSWNPWREFITSGNISSQKADGALRLWAQTHPNDYYITHSWTGAHWYITSNHGSPVRVGYSDLAGNTNSISNVLGTSHTWTAIQYFQTDNGGQSVNNSNSAKLQAYSTGNNSAFMSFHKAGHWAINFGLDDDNVLRIGGWSAAANRWQLSGVSGDCTVSGFQRAVDFYTTGWYRNYGTGGLYQQDYGGHFARSTDGSYGTWQIWGGGRGGYSGLNIIDPQGYWSNLMWENGSGGIYQQNGQSWIIYFYYGNDCLGLSGSETYDWVRACTNGKHRITNDSWCDATSWAYTFSNISDGRLKENIITVDSALDKVLQLRGVYYNWIIDTENKKHIGLIAQETAAVCPEVVNYHEETDTYSVNYSELSGLFVESTKELNQKLMDANARIELLESKLNQLLNA